jgi:hypothetical protein
MKSNRSFSLDIEEAHRRLEAWRKSRRRGKRIPAPLAGALVVFSSRRRKALKCLVFDGQGFWLCQKRLSTGRFAWWPTDAKPPTFGLGAHQLQSLLWNAKPASTQAVPLWRPITPTG